MKKLFATLLFLLLPIPAMGAVAFVAADSVVTTSSNTASVAFDATGADFLLVCVAVRDLDAGLTVSSMVYNSVALTLVDSETIENIDDTQFEDLYMYRLTAPTTGSNTLAVTMSGAAENIVLGVMSFSGVHASSPLGATTKIGTVDAAVQTTSSVDVASAANEFAADCFFLYGTDADIESITDNSDIQWSEATNSIIQVQGSTKAGAAPTVNFTRDWTNFLRSAQIGVSIKPSGGAAVGTRGRAMILQ